ncbi:hypothetical protein MSPP1_001416 [Malassezia sp. CBS 17886]|nr:hypothetical protein MSPP1_001416 [Malassezia sp. CBS 17886]
MNLTAPSSSMRGLTQYIAELRACTVREAEEKCVNREMAHIRMKLQSAAKLDGYQRKKYVAKVIFTFLQGYKVDVGLMEAVTLVTSTRYAEKQIGYLALTLLVHESHGLVRMVVNSIRKDLASMDEVNTCLALHAVANIGSLEMVEALAEDVLKLLLSPCVVKKAALTVVRMYRRVPTCIPLAEWSATLADLLQLRDLGVAQCVATLVSVLAADDPMSYMCCYAPSVQLLYSIVIRNECDASHVYYEIPVPWLQVKLLRLLQYFPSPTDARIVKTLDAVLQHLLQPSRSIPSTRVQQGNAHNAVLFEAIRLAMHLDTGSLLVARSAVLLGKFLKSRETNVRYLGLETMAVLAGRLTSLAPVKMHQETILSSLYDKDVSVRRRTLTLLYAMCDQENGQQVVSYLLQYLQHVDHSLREEVALKTSILAERFADELSWYIDATLSLVSIAGDQVSDKVWHRTIQIVANNPDTQRYAAARVFQHMERPSVHEALVRIGGYVLGEYGHLIANDPGMGPAEQFHVLHTRSHLCSPRTRALLLTTYLKWINQYPELREDILFVFRRSQRALDLEMQQRACEYMVLAELGDCALVDTVCAEMPPFPGDELSRLPRGETVRGAGDTAPRVEAAKKLELPFGGAPAGAWRRDGGMGPPRPGGEGDGLGEAREDTPVQSSASLPSFAITAPEKNGRHVSAATDNCFLSSGDQHTPRVGSALLDLHGLDFGPPRDAPRSHAAGDAVPSKPLVLGGSDTLGFLGRPTGGRSDASGSAIAQDATARPAGDGSPNRAPGAAPQLACTPPVLIASPSADAPALLFTTSFARRAEQREYGVLTVAAHGADGVSLQAVRVVDTPSGLVVGEPARDRDAWSVPLTCERCFAGALEADVDVQCRDTLRTERTALPATLALFMDPIGMGTENFFQRWKLMRPEDQLEAQCVFPIALTADGTAPSRTFKRVVQRLGFRVLHGLDRREGNIVGAGVLRTSSAPIGALMRLEPNAAAELARLTVRSARADVSRVLLALLEAQLLQTQG